MSGVLRRLPFRIYPLPDEPLDSWLEVMAAAHRCSLGEMLTALGLTGPHAAPDDQGYSPGAHSRWLHRLQDEQLQRLTAATGIGVDDLQAMTRSAFASTVTKYTRKGRISTQCPTAGTEGRYCPECLLDSGGRWRLSWTYAFVSICPRHQRVLADHCPGCGLAPRGRHHPRYAIPVPGLCHNRPDRASDHRSRCGADLRDSPPGAPASPGMLAAQRAQFAAISSGFARFGVYGDAPPSASLVMEDVRYLARVAIKALVRGDDIDIADLPTEVIASVRNDPSALRGERPRTALQSAVGAAIAFHATQSQEAMLSLLDGRIAPSSIFDRHTPQLQNAVAQSRGRRMRTYTRLQLSIPPTEDEHIRASKLPARLWDDWTTLLAPARTRPDLAAVALSVATMIAGTRLTHAQALHHLGSPLPVKAVRTVTSRIAGATTSHDGLALVARLATYLDAHHTPIDYQRRRRLDYTTLLPSEQWAEIAARVNIHIGSAARLRHVRRLLYCWLSGNHPEQAPTRYRAVTCGDRTRANELASTLPTELERELLAVAAEFLDAQGIDEPVRWSPPLELAKQLLALSAPHRPSHQIGASAGWAARRPAAARVRTTFSAVELAGRYRSGTSLRDLAAAASTSRKVVGDLLRDAGVELRPAHAPRRITVTDDWLRKQYEQEQRSVTDIAHQVQCAPATIARRLRTTGVQIRRRGGVSHATRLRSAAEQDAPELIRRAFTCANPLERAQRFLVVADSRTYGEAAARVGVAPSGLSAQMGRLAADVGGPLLLGAQRDRPLTLTALGRRLQRQLIVHLNATDASGQSAEQDCVSVSSQRTVFADARVTHPIAGLPRRDN